MKIFRSFDTCGQHTSLWAMGEPKPWAKLTNPFKEMRNAKGFGKKATLNANDIEENSQTKLIQNTILAPILHGYAK